MFTRPTSLRVACAVGAITVFGAIERASAQIVTYTERPVWVASVGGSANCDPIEADAPGSYPTPFNTTMGWGFVNGRGIAQSIQVSPGAPVNGSQAVSFRDLGGGIAMNSPCNPSMGMGFSYFSQAPWTVTIGGNSYPLQAGAASFFGFSSMAPLTSITFTSAAGGNAALFLDDICCSINPATKGGACCYTNTVGVLTCSEMSLDECNALSGTFFGVGSSCNPSPCPQTLMGACCYVSNGALTCSIVTSAECQALGGQYYGDNSVCTPDLCQVQSFGACCYQAPNGYTCAIVTPLECSFLNGTYFGDNSSCDPNPCNPPPGLCNVVAGDCCAGRPDINDPFYQTFPQLVSVGTASRVAAGTAVVSIFGLNNPSGGPFNTDFGAPIYSHPSWNEVNLGSVFGVALDAGGNIYVTATSSYGWFATAPGALGGNFGVVYRLDGVTGNATVFATLPNANNTGLGNITYDCGNNQFFVSNMEDGKIYRLSAAGAIINTYDFGAPDVAANTFAPLGDRIWAVEVHNNRLYFSVWWEDAARPSATSANQIWSIALNGVGDFSGAPQLDVMMPANPGSQYSNPVSDIRFTPTGSMLAAERGMAGDTEPTPHQSRLLEFVCEDGKWVASPNTFGVGVGNGFNTAGGVDMDYSANGFVYATGDALQLGPQILYGTQGIPATGGTVANSIIVDFNGQFNQFDKTQIGSVAVPCLLEEPCLNVSQMKVLCPSETNPCFTATFNVTNKSGQPVKYITIPLHPSPNSPITINPNIINLVTQDGSLLEDGETTTITLTICNANPGDEFCLTMSLITPGFEICCFEEVCFTMPSCDCGQIRDQEMIEVTCGPNGMATVTFNFTLDNLSGFPADWVIFVPRKNQPGYFVKDFFFLPPLQPGGSIPMSVQITGAQPGELFCFDVLLQHPHMAVDGCCCAFEKCIMIPDCPEPSMCAGDVNGDLTVGVPDLLAVISAWGPCPTSCPPGCAADLNNDCTVGVPDLLQVIGAWGGCFDQH